MTQPLESVLVVSCTHGRGWGAEEVLEHYLRAGASVQIAAPLDSRFPGILSELDASTRFHPLSKKRNAFHQNILSGSFLKLPRGPSLIHAWCARSVETAWILSKKSGVPFSVGLHDSPDQHYHSAARRKIVSMACHRAVAVATVSQAMAEKCRNLGLCQNPWVIPNGIPDMKPVPAHPLERPCTVGFLGMNAARKGFRTVARWVRATEGLCWRLYGEMDPVLEAEARELLQRCQDRVTYCGRRPVEEIYPEVDLVVMPSVDFEPFGLVAVEAGRAHLPIVAAAVGGLCEIIEEGKSGFLYPEHSPEVGLAALRRLCADSTLRRQMGERGRAIFEEQFTVGKMKMGWDAYFQECIT